MPPIHFLDIIKLQSTNEVFFPKSLYPLIHRAVSLVSPCCSFKYRISVCSNACLKELSSGGKHHDSTMKLIYIRALFAPTSDQHPTFASSCWVSFPRFHSQSFVPPRSSGTFSSGCVCGLVWMIQGFCVRPKLAWRLHSFYAGEPRVP